MPCCYEIFTEMGWLSTFLVGMVMGRENITRDTNSWAVVSSRNPYLLCLDASSSQTRRTWKKKSTVSASLGTRDFVPQKDSGDVR